MQRRFVRGNELRTDDGNIKLADMRALPIVGTLAGCVITQKCGELSSKGCFVTRINECLATIVHRAGIAGIVAGHHSTTGCGHRFDEANAEALAAGAGKYGEVGASQEGRLVLLFDEASKLHYRIEFMSCNKFAQARFKRSATPDDNAKMTIVYMSLDHPRNGAQQRGAAFALHEPA